MSRVGYTIQILSAVSVFALAGCGDGWTTQPYSNTPYGDRTAGFGVEYVRAKMAPAKGPVAMPEPEVTPPPPPAPEPEPVITPEPEVKDAAPVFDRMQSK